MREVVGLLIIVAGGSLGVAVRMGWHPIAQWRAKRRERQAIKRAAKWLQARYPSETDTWTGEQWLEASDALGGPFKTFQPIRGLPNDV